MVELWFCSCGQVVSALSALGVAGSWLRNLFMIKSGFYGRLGFAILWGFGERNNKSSERYIWFFVRFSVSLLASVSKLFCTYLLGLISLMVSLLFVGFFIFVWSCILSLSQWKVKFFYLEENRLNAQILHSLA